MYEVEALVGKRTKEGRIQYEVKWQATMSPDLSARDAGAKRSREHKWEVGEAQSGRAARSEVRTKVVEVEASGTGCARPRRLKAPLSLRARGLLRPDDAREHQRARSRTRRRRPARAASHRASQSRDAAHDGTGFAGLACSVRDPRAVEVCWPVSGGRHGIPYSPRISGQRTPDSAELLRRSRCTRGHASSKATRHAPLSTNALRTCSALRRRHRGGSSFRRLGSWTVRCRRLRWLV